LICNSARCGDSSFDGRPIPADSTFVTYKLKNILVAGQCFEKVLGRFHNVPPNGLQLTLTRFVHQMEQNRASLDVSVSTEGDIESSGSAISFFPRDGV
jgi:hypothetical protein